MNTMQFTKVFDYVKSTEEDLSDLKFMIDDEFSYDLRQDLVRVTLNTTEEDVVWEEFMYEYVRDTFNYNLVPEEMALFGMLHEIGHAKTLYTFSIDQIKQYVKDLDSLETEDFYNYRQLDIEYVADKWAIDYMIQHKEQLNNILK